MGCMVNSDAISGFLHLSKNSWTTRSSLNSGGGERERAEG